MDPIILAIATAVSTGAASGIGERAGTAMATLISRVRRRLTTIGEKPEETAAALEAEFTRDPAFAEEIRTLWHQSDHENSFTGTADNVVQIQQNNGPITFNGA